MHSRASSDRTPSRPNPVAELRRAEFDTMPLGGYKGEFASPPAAPPPKPPEPLRIDPPDWQSEMAERAASEPAAASPPPALVALADYDPPPPPGPPMRIEPLIRPTLPPPNWLQEEAARAQRELEPEQPAYPAPKQRREQPS